VYVPISGIQQWIQIKGNNADNPVLLFLHGGPGGTSRPAAIAWKPWEEYFTVVHWDQRGAAQTFLMNGEAGCGALTLDLIVDDGIAVAEYLRASLNKNKILLVGHSWGSVVGIHMVKKHPDLFSGFVGTGQLINFQKAEEFIYRRLVDRAEQSANAEAIKALTDLGPPPYTSRSAFLSSRQWAEKLAEPSEDAAQPRPTPHNSEITAVEGQAIMRGLEYSRAQLFPVYNQINLPLLGPHFDVPIFFFLGKADQVTPSELVVEYFNSLSAPKKELVQFESYGHYFVMNRPNDFLRELVDKVRPYLAS
jgi:pimeloyl-ACP methyl ester carboxylesterase